MPPAGAADTAANTWVYPGADGHLIYRTTPAGDRIMDFSSAGYEGGGVALPTIPEQQTVSPSRGEDDTAAIQSAIDAVAALPLAHGFRGAVRLGPGVFTCARSIVINASGVVLRGSGTGASGTTIKMVGSRHVAISIGLVRGTPSGDDSESSRTPPETAAKSRSTNFTTEIADGYVPAGTSSFTVVDARGFAVGDQIAIRRPTSAAWLKLMQMDTLKRDGKSQTWIGESRGGVTERTIMAISGNRLSLDLPLADSYDAKFLNPPGTVVAKFKPASRLTHVGVESVHLQCPPLEIAYGQAPYSAIRVGGDDCWVKDVYCEETMNATVLAGKRITLEGVRVSHTFPNLGASKPTDFSIEGSQILLDRCQVTGDNEYFVWTTSLDPGPNVVLNCTFNGRGSRIQPHMRWSTGLLVDNCAVPDGGIDFMNRGVAGSGHGWTMGWAVAWNCVAKTYIIQNPPGAMNWAIGNRGARVQTARLFDSAPILPEGAFESHGTPVTPASLYLAQLNERLGPAALKNLGYSPRPDRELAEKSIHTLPEFPVERDPILGPNLALHRPVDTSRPRGGSVKFGGEKALDADPASYWATDNGVSPATFEVDLEGPVDINAIAIEEMPGLGTRVLQYKIEGQVASDWKLLSQGTTIGEHQVDRFPIATVWKVRLTILQAQPYAAIRKFGLYLAPH
jgi:hypothetical protein